MAACSDSFSITVTGSGINADISSVKVTVNPIGSGSVIQSFVVDFTYVTGEPPATAFSVVWSADPPGASLPGSWFFSPPLPSGLQPRSQVRTGLLQGTVPTPSETTTFSGTLTIHQE